MEQNICIEFFVGDMHLSTILQFTAVFLLIMMDWPLLQHSMAMLEIYLGLVILSQPTKCSSSNKLFRQFSDTHGPNMALLNAS